MARFASQLRIPVLESHRINWIDFSIHSSLPRSRGWGWACRSAVRLSNRTAVTCGRHREPHMERSFGSTCPPAHLDDCAVRRSSHHVIFLVTIISLSVIALSAGADARTKNSGRGTVALPQTNPSGPVPIPYLSRGGQGCSGKILRATNNYRSAIAKNTGQDNARSNNIR